MCATVHPTIWRKIWRMKCRLKVDTKPIPTPSYTPIGQPENMSRQSSRNRYLRLLVGPNSLLALPKERVRCDLKRPKNRLLICVQSLFFFSFFASADEWHWQMCVCVCVCVCVCARTHDASCHLFTRAVKRGEEGEEENNARIQNNKHCVDAEPRHIIKQFFTLAKKSPWMHIFPIVQRPYLLTDAENQNQVFKKLARLGLVTKWSDCTTKYMGMASGS